MFEIGHLPYSKCTFGVYVQYMPEPAATSMQSDQGHGCRLTKSLDTVEYIDTESNLC